MGSCILRPLELSPSRPGSPVGRPLVPEPSQQAGLSCSVQGVSGGLLTFGFPQLRLQTSHLGDEGIVFLRHLAQGGEQLPRGFLPGYRIFLREALRDKRTRKAMDAGRVEGCAS